MNIEAEKKVVSEKKRGRKKINPEDYKSCKSCYSNKQYKDFYYGCSVCKECRKIIDRDSYLKRMSKISEMENVVSL